ncbi:MAG: hypothetical protein GXP25_12925 [Planctomycetes bacterium]|nr:hypothetical protein [Planctomycetota bacterium]
MAGTLKVGTGVIDITPPIGVSLAGGLRARKSTGIQTNLYAKATVFDNGETAICLIAVDLCVLGRDYVDKATALIEERTGIPPENVMVTASHTHAGPYTSPVFGKEEDRDQEYLAILSRYIADSAAIAQQNLVAAQVGSASGKEETSSHYRRVKLKAGHVRNTWMKLDPDEVVGPVGEIDPELGVMLTRDMEGNAVSVIFNYTLHANCHDDRALIDGSYPSRVAKIVEGEIGGMTSYTPGACGNINPVGKPDPIARALSDEILRVIPKIETTSDVALRAKKVSVELPLRDFSRCRTEAIRRDWPEGEDVFTEEWQKLHEAGDTSVETSVQVLAINDTAFAATPGELFVEIGREIKERSPFERTYVVELANDYVGYVPTRVAFEEGGYEVLDARSSKVGPEAGEIVRDRCVKLLHEVAGDG